MEKLVIMGMIESKNWTNNKILLESLLVRAVRGWPNISPLELIRRPKPWKRDRRRCLQRHCIGTLRSRKNKRKRRETIKSARRM